MLRDEMRTGHVMIITPLTKLNDESRRRTSILCEEALTRIANIQEHLAGPRTTKKGRGRT